MSQDDLHDKNIFKDDGSNLHMSENLCQLHFAQTNFVGSLPEWLKMVDEKLDKILKVLDENTKITANCVTVTTKLQTEVNQLKNTVTSEFVEVKQDLRKQDDRISKLERAMMTGPLPAPPRPGSSTAASSSMGEAESLDGNFSTLRSSPYMTDAEKRTRTRRTLKVDGFAWKEDLKVRQFFVEHAMRVMARATCEDCIAANAPPGLCDRCLKLRNLVPMMKARMQFNGVKRDAVWILMNNRNDAFLVQKYWKNLEIDEETKDFTPLEQAKAKTINEPKNMRIYVGPARDRRVLRMTVDQLAPDRKRNGALYSAWTKGRVTKQRKKNRREK